MKFLLIAVALVGMAAAYDNGQYKPFEATKFVQKARYVQPVQQKVVTYTKPVQAVHTYTPVAYTAQPTYYKNQDAHYKTLRNINENFINSYNYEYLTENQIHAAESGTVREIGAESPALESTGFYQYVGDDGQTYRVNYVANENGFQPTGDHLPVSPPIPEAIQRSLAYQARVLGH